MKKIEIITRTENLDTIKRVLAKNEYSGMTVTSVMGCGNQKSSSNEFEDLNVEQNLINQIIIRYSTSNLIKAFIEELKKLKENDGYIYDEKTKSDFRDNY